jgi:TIR domain
LMHVFVAGRKMTDNKKSQIFISYSQKDRLAADQIFDVLRDTFEDDIQVWLDIHQIRPGDHLSTEIEKGLKESDYYLLLISENSNTSTWVRREIASAIGLADRKKLAVIPFLLDKVDIPLEFKGLLYIDGSSSLISGIKKLVEFFRSEDEPTRGMKTPPIIRKSGDILASIGRCHFVLSEMKRRDLRFQMLKRLTIENIQEVWYDLFETRMQDDTQIQNLGLACVEILARCERDDLFETLYEILCRSYPRIIQPAKP